MISIPQKTQEIINKDLVLKDLISRNLINLSELARQLKPEIEDSLLKDVTEASILMALKRYSYNLNYNSKKVNFWNHLGDISIKSGLFEITIPNSTKTYLKLNKVLSRFENDHSSYITFIRGVVQTTIIASNNIFDEIIDTFKNVDSIVIQNLSSISVRLINNHLATPGIMAFVLSVLSAYGINIIEVVSTADELTVIIKAEDITKAFEALNKR